jgi:hypothetical protein
VDGEPEDQSEDLDVDGRTNLKWILRKQGVDWIHMVQNRRAFLNIFYYSLLNIAYGSVITFYSFAVSDYLSGSKLFQLTSFNI